jgi:hypothetical protein
MKDNYFIANEKQRVQHFLHSRWGEKVAIVHTNFSDQMLFENRDKKKWIIWSMEDP